MSNNDAVHEIFVDELRDAYDFEKRLVKALKQMARSSSNPELEAAFSSHLEETTGHVAMLEEVFELVDLKPRGKHCAGMAGIIEEGNEAIDEKKDEPAVRDIALIGGARRAEHYEMAAYLIQDTRLCRECGALESYADSQVRSRSCMLLVSRCRTRR